MAILLIAHGSRNAEANADTHFLAEQLRRHGGFQCVAAAFLEQAGPDIDAAALQCVASGAQRVVLLPHFLSAGVHVRRDLTAARQRLAERFPKVEFALAEPIGQHPRLLEILMDRIREAGAGER
ncbi:MAG TPA: CbiX/SirB N-terminal domain-containing protein [Gemmataceae bacterium]|jgi:sirohydrochlorin ferrochelatase|nr:CbiX/SirB N-terminal domain-containing protein [Gemmataceae bacterium]